MNSNQPEPSAAAIALLAQLNGCESVDPAVIIDRYLREARREGMHSDKAGMEWQDLCAKLKAMNEQQARMISRGEFPQDHIRECAKKACRNLGADENGKAFVIICEAFGLPKKDKFAVWFEGELLREKAESAGMELTANEKEIAEHFAKAAWKIAKGEK